MRFDEHHQVYDFQIEATNTATDEEQVAAVAGKRIRVMSFVVCSSANPMTFTWSGGPAIGPHFLSPGKNWVAPHDPCGWFQTDVGDALGITQGGNGNTGGHGTYILI
jgi:hypothetical protein